MDVTARNSDQNVTKICVCPADGLGTCEFKYGAYRTDSLQGMSKISFEYSNCTKMAKWIHFRDKLCQKYTLYQKFLRLKVCSKISFVYGYSFFQFMPLTNIKLAIHLSFLAFRHVCALFREIVIQSLYTSHNIANFVHL